VGKLVFSWGGNPGVGSLHRLRDAVERQWPNALAIEEHSHAAMAAAYAAGAAGLPCAVLRGYAGSDLVHYNANIRTIECPFTGEQLAAVPAIRPDVAVIHAQRADRQGNVLIEGIVGVQKEVVLAARRAIVTVEEVVDDLHPPSVNSVVLPYWTVAAIAEVPRGARPSYLATSSAVGRTPAFVAKARDMGVFLKRRRSPLDPPRSPRRPPRRPRQRDKPRERI